MDNEVKILLTSDLHLGLSGGELNMPERVRISTFKKISSLARDHDILLVAGDLFHRSDPGSEVVETVKNEFQMLSDSGVEVILTPGVGEINKSGNIADILGSLNISKIFSSKEIEEPYHITKSGQDFYFYGVPASCNYDISGIKKVSESGFHVGLFHVDFNPADGNSGSTVYSLQKSDIKTLQLDFYALGYSHNFRMFKIMDRIIGAYPGTPEPVTFSETGDRYIISFTVKNSEISNIRRLSVNSVKVVDEEIDCGLIETRAMFLKKISSFKSKKTILRIKLKGKRNFAIDKNEIYSEREEFCDLLIVDESFKMIGAIIDEFGNENSIRGEFCRLLREKSGTFQDDIDMEKLAYIVNILTERGNRSVEECLCSL